MIIIALGANLPSDIGSPKETLEAALSAMPSYGLRVVKLSKWYETEPVPKSDQPNYVNGAAVLASDLDAQNVLAALHRIEADFGRRRSVLNAARCLDLDLLDYNGLCLDGEITIPHPRMHQRGFVLYPLRDIAPDWIHPISGKTLTMLIDDLPDDQHIA